MRFAIILGVLVWLAASVALAQSNDTVRLADGGIVRGTVLDYVPGDHVTLQLSTGEMRTYRAGEFVDVAIGPAAPIVVPVPVPVAPPTEPMAHLSVTGDVEGLSLHRVIASATVGVWTGRGMSSVRIDAFDLICHAPCEVDVPAGSYELGVAPDGGDARRAGHDDAVFHAGTVSRLALEFESREGIRIAGWLTLVLGGLGGSAMIISPIFFTNFDDGMPLLIAGSVIAGVAIIASLPMILLQDHADVRPLRDFARALGEGVHF